MYNFNAKTCRAMRYVSRTMECLFTCIKLWKQRESIYKHVGLHTCMINNDRALNCISIEIFPFARAQIGKGRSGRSSGVSGIIFTLQSMLRYESLALLRSVRLSFTHMGIRASCIARFVLSLRCVCVRIASRLDRDRPNVKRNFAARLRAIALSPSDTVIWWAKIIIALSAGRNVVTRNYICPCILTIGHKRKLMYSFTKINRCLNIFYIVSYRILFYMLSIELFVMRYADYFIMQKCFMKMFI